MTSLNDKEKSHELQSILDGIIDPLILIDKNFNIQRVNKGTLNFIHSKNFKEIINQKCYEMIYGRTEKCPYCPFKKTGLETEFNTFFSESSSDSKRLHREIYIQKEKGKQTYNLEFFPIEKDDFIYSIVEKINNITELKDNEDENLRIRNLASLGILISGVAHELNNPLTGISLTLQNLINNLNLYNQKFIQERLDMIQKDLSRAAIIVADILSFSKPEKLKSTLGNLTEIINNSVLTVTRLYPVLAKRITWKISCNDELIFHFNPVKMERLFLNLFRNSLQAFNYSRGSINVSCKMSKNKVIIKVEDNAGGIPQNILEKIFDPFFSRKESGTGTGLGLSICHSIVNEHSGAIKVKSINKKTIFTITLPIDQNEYTVRNTTEDK